MSEGSISAEDTQTLAAIPITFGRTVVPVKNINKETKKTSLGFEYAEHCFIGDAATLTLANTTTIPASDYKFTLKNGLQVTYGQINGLAGDFYGTDAPISDGTSDSDRADRFILAFNTLADPSKRQPKEAQDILNVLVAEVEAVNEALKNHQDPSVVYSQLPDVNWTLNGITKGRPKGQLSYFDLARINWDHFGQDARIAYNAGHGAALQKAVQGDLDGAYMLNAFADHFLEDSFSAGHLREPRRALHEDGLMYFSSDLCAKYMHDEDNAIGINVSNTAGQSWRMYGDKRALDQEDEDNKDRCVAAVQASVDEIYAAFSTRQVPSPADYKAWTFTPTLESARGTQELAPLFNWEKGRRKELAKRRDWVYKTNWWPATTAFDCYWSGLWKYPITLDGIVKIVPWTSIAATVPSSGSARVLYQRPDGGLLESSFNNNLWTEGVDSPPITTALLWSPLATVSWNNGREVRVFYLDKDYILQDYCLSTDRGSSWYAGQLGSLRIKGATNSSLAAVQWSEKGYQTPRIRLYLQEDGSNIIQEICNDGSWVRGAQLPTALRGTGIAALVFIWRDNLQIRVYYQTEDLTLRETQWFRSHPSIGWHGGQFNPQGLKAPGCVPITAVDYYSPSSDRELRIFWRTLQDDIVESTWYGEWASARTVTKGVKYGWKFAAVQWDDGKHLRLYYQAEDGSLNEIRNDNFRGWGQNVVVGEAK